MTELDRLKEHRNRLFWRHERLKFLCAGGVVGYGVSALLWILGFPETIGPLFMVPFGVACMAFPMWLTGLWKR